MISFKNFLKKLSEDSSMPVNNIGSGYIAGADPMLGSTKTPVTAALKRRPTTRVLKRRKSSI